MAGRLAFLLFTACSLGLSGEAKINDFSFLSGHWRTEIWGGTGEEIWTEAANGNMLCVFRFFKDGKLQFTELLSLDEGATGVVLHMRHFYPALKAWEEKDAPLKWRIEESRPNEVFFGREGDSAATGMRYVRESPDELKAVLVRTKNGKQEESVFRYKRVK